ncbi:MAG: aminopeptidase P family N-terminal domain-containing protein, partial [Vicinamibacterales bacterium]
MPAGTSAPWAGRLARLRVELGRARVDALIVTHPPNLRYLTSFHGSAGALLIMPARTLLVVDFRYGVAARAAALLSGCDTVVAPVSLDPTIVEALRASGASRIGVEGQWLSVAR